MTKLDWLKQNRKFWIVFAIIFLVALFLLKTTSLFENKETYQRATEENGLSYANVAIKDLVNKDTDGDGILDWEEDLWGTDPTKKETTPGTSDSIAIEKLKIEEEKTGTEKKISETVPEKLTKTEQFSRELFATVVSLNQNGQMDDATIEKLSSSLAEQIQNSATRKTYKISDLKIIENDTTEATQKYSDGLNNIYAKYHNEKGVLETLQKFMDKEEDVEILKELDPIINQANKIINELLKMQVPRTLSLLHLDSINSLEKVVENVNDIRLLDSDVILAIGAIGQYEKSASALEASTNKLIETIKQKLNI